MLNLQRKNQSLMGIKSYFEDHWTYFRADLRARDDKGWTDMKLVGVDDAGHFSSVKVSVFWQSVFLSPSSLVLVIKINHLENPAGSPCCGVAPAV